MKTTKGCPISQIYLETGQWPARFQIKKLRILFLKSILDENAESIVSKFFKLQLQHPTKGDWVSTCKSDLNEMKIELSFQEIKAMSKESFTKMIKCKIPEIALKYLLEKRGSKGKEIVYKKLEMAEYLMPYETRLKIEDKRKLFSLRNRMIDIGNNFGKTEKCSKCKTKEDMEHIFYCEYWSKQENDIPYEKVYNGNLNEQIDILRIFEKKFEKRNEERLKSKNPSCDPNCCDPLFFVQYRNGYIKPRNISLATGPELGNYTFPDGRSDSDNNATQPSWGLG